MGVFSVAPQWGKGIRENSSHLLGRPRCARPGAKHLTGIAPFSLHEDLGGGYQNDLLVPDMETEVWRSQVYLGPPIP